MNQAQRFGHCRDDLLSLDQVRRLLLELQLAARHGAHSGYIISVPLAWIESFSKEGGLLGRGQSGLRTTLYPPPR